jgi:hypothetical protein
MTLPPRWPLALALMIGAALLALFWWLPPFTAERALLHRHETFLSRIAAGQWTRAGWLVSDDYSDRWGFTKATLVEQGSNVARHFRWMEISRSEETWTHEARRAEVSARIVLQGEGTALAAAAREAVNALRTPWVVTWEKTGRWPWSWQVTAIDHPAFDIRRVQAW